MTLVDPSHEEGTIRRACPEDVPALVALLADDPLGATREDPSDPLPGAYYDAFEAISADPNHELMVLEAGGRIAGTLHLTILPSLTYRGRQRAQIEAVRVARTDRGTGFGSSLVQWAVSRARERGCGLVQLTTDKSRPQAIDFYEALGFRATHEGMKLHLP